MYRRDRLKIIASRTKNPEDWSNFKTMRNQVNNSIKNAKTSYYNNTFKTCDGNLRKTWQVINEVTSRKSNKSVISELEYSGKKTNNPIEIAESFNKFFFEIGPELSKQIKDVDVSYEEFLSETNEEFHFETIAQSQVLWHLTKLCRSKVTGLDSISARLLRECPDLISKSLTRIFNRSIVTGSFPDEWKNARITPLFKNAGKRIDQSNYRPISIIPVWQRFLNA